jgi:hypothetical protein
MTKWINSQSVFTIYTHKLLIADRQVIFAEPKSDAEPVLPCLRQIEVVRFPSRPTLVGSSGSVQKGPDCESKQVYVARAMKGKSHGG